jgi:catechol 2,3-dioxygenase-like lactoylglutathione lyase family enzyme
MTSLLHEVAHLGHAELLAPEPEKSLWFFTEVLGLTGNGRSGDSVYLRTWADYEHHSLKLTAQWTFFLYVYEPGGNRIELSNPCARLIFAPGLAPITRTEAGRAKGQAGGLATIASFHTHGTPPAG